MGRAVVEMVNVALEGLVPTSVMELGEKVHVVPVGALPQESEMLPL